MRVLITGASRGIGASIANFFASKTNCQIALLARSLDTPSHSKLKGSLLDVVDQVKKKGSIAHPFQCNIKNGKDLENTVDNVLKKMGGIDILVNNASMLMLNPNPSLKERDIVHNVNARATMICIDKCLESLEKNDGSIVTISPPITPDMAAKTTATAIVCMATPPLNFPAKIDIASNKSSAIPALSKIEAMRTNKGTATRGYFSKSPKAFVETR